MDSQYIEESSQMIPKKSNYREFIVSNWE